MSQAIQLATERSGGHFEYLSLSDPAVPLVDSYHRFRNSLARADDLGESEVGPLVVLDDVSALGWMGHGVHELLQWWNGLRSLLESVRVSVGEAVHPRARLKGSFPRRAGGASHRTERWV